MEPLNDDELRGLLRQWQAPDAPPSLDARVLGARRRDPWWKWLLTGSIRIPAPVGILAAVAIAWILLLSWRSAHLPAQQVNFSNFQPVTDLKPRIVGSSYENR